MTKEQLKILYREFIRLVDDYAQDALKQDSPGPRVACATACMVFYGLAISLIPLIKEDAPHDASTHS